VRPPDGEEKIDDEPLTERIVISQVFLDRLRIPGRRRRRRKTFGKLGVVDHIPSPVFSEKKTHRSYP
jgi:hypothetical protein